MEPTGAAQPADKPTRSNEAQRAEFQPVRMKRTMLTADSASEVPPCTRCGVPRASAPGGGTTRQCRSALRFALPDATMPSCCAGAAGTGPGFATPLDAFRSGERETLAYVPVTTRYHTRPDYLATIDLTTSKARAHAKHAVAGRLTSQLLPSSAGHRAASDAPPR